MRHSGAKVSLVILGAGMARRFGGNKLSVDCAGKPLGQWAVITAWALNKGGHCTAPVCITDHAEADWPCGDGHSQKARCIVNSRPDLGLSHSLHLAMAAAETMGADAALVMLADMPMVTQTTLHMLMDATLSTGHAAAIRHDGDRPGVPACFPAQDFGALRALTGDQGAGAYLRSLSRLTLIDVSDAERLDVDTPAMLALAAERLTMRENRGGFPEPHNPSTSAPKAPS